MLTLSEKKCDVLHNRCDCMNRVHEYANEVVPKLLDALKHGFRLTNSFQLFSKDKSRLCDLLRLADEKQQLSQGSTGMKGSSAFLRSDEYNIYLEISDNYPVKYHGHGSNGYTCDYYKRTVYLWNHRDNKAMDYTMLPLHTHNQMDVAKAKLIEVQDAIAELKDQVYPLKRLIGE